MQEMTSPRPSLSSFLELAAFRIPPRVPLQQDTSDLDIRDLCAIVAREQQQAEPYEPLVRPYGVIQNFFTDLSHSQRVDEGAFRYLLPFALQAWTDGLLGSSDAQQATGEFHVALFRKHAILRGILSEGETLGIVGYATATLNWFVDLGCVAESPNLAWVPNWVGLCCGMPALTSSWIDRLKTAASRGLINAYLSYVSRIAYAPNENPLFLQSISSIEPWTRETFITSGCYWMPESLLAWQSEFSTSSVRSALRLILLSPLAGEFELTVAADILQRLSTFERRAGEALANLSEVNPADYWSDAF